MAPRTAPCALALAIAACLLSAPAAAQSGSVQGTQSESNDLPLYRMPPAPPAMPSPPPPTVTAPVTVITPTPEPTALPAAQTATPAPDGSDPTTYRRQISDFYQQNAAIYDTQLRKLAEDTRLLEQFKSQLGAAKISAVGQAANAVASGNVPVDPSGASSQNTVDSLAIGTTPVQEGNRSLDNLANNVQVDKVAVAKSKEKMEYYREILTRIDRTAPAPR